MRAQGGIKNVLPPHPYPLPLIGGEEKGEGVILSALTNGDLCIKIANDKLDLF